MSLRHMLALAAEKVPDEEAIVEGPVRLTYREWIERIYALADAFTRAGIERGDRVAYLMRNTIDHATVFFGLQSIGAVAVPINFRSKANGITYIIEDTDARMFVTDDPELKARLATDVPRKLRWIVACEEEIEGTERLEDVIAAGALREPADHIDADDLSGILYTSGTTGQPKGVVITHRGVIGRILTYTMSGGPLYGSGVRSLGAAPLYHTVGLHMVLCRTVFLNGTYFPVREIGGRSALELIQNEQLTLILGSPTLYHMLVEANRDHGFDLRSVNHISYGSAAMPPSLLAAIREHFPSASVQETYGTTEISIPFVTVEPEQPGELKITADNRVRVVKPGGRADEILPPGEVGELIAHHDTDGSFLSYWKRDDLTAERIRDGWYHTGDAFFRDERNVYYITGRLDDMFISGGENIQPVEVEQTLSSHPGIADVAVIGTPHERWGEAVTALVVRRDLALTETEIDAFCRRSDLDDFKRPRRVIFVEEIQRNPSGKIVRKELWEKYLPEALALPV